MKQLQLFAFDGNHYCDFTSSAAKAIAGKDILLCIWNMEGTELLAISGQQGLTINRSADSIEITSKDTQGGWKSYLAGMKEWSIDNDGLFVPNDQSHSMVALVRMQAKSLSDTDALTVTALFPKWESGIAYQEGDRFTYGDEFYKVLQDHTSEEQWKLGEAPSLYVLISDPAVEWPEWREPTGAHDAYNTGDKVTYGGKRYISQIDGNTVVPGTDERYWKESEE